MTVQDNNKEYRRIINQVEQLQNAFVEIGFQEGEVTKSQSKGGRTKQAGLSMPQIAADNEFGTREIPARPFMRTSFDENRQRINNFILSEYDDVLTGKSNTRRSLNRIGLLGVDLVQVKIRSITNPPNSPKTIALKRSSKPLIDFGQMIQSVKFKVTIL